MESGNKLPSAYQAEERVRFSLDGATFYNATVGRVLFSESKVKYDLEIEEPGTLLPDIDSAFVFPLA